MVSLNFPSQEKPVVQQCGDVFVAAWLDRWSGRTQVSLRRFLSDGTPLDPPNRAIETTREGSDLALTCGRDSFLLSWWDEYTYTRRLAFGQTRGDHVSMSTLHGKDGAAIFVGEHFVIFSGSSETSRLSRWTEQGTPVLTRSLRLSERRIYQRALSWSGEYFYAAWEQEGTFRTALRARRLDRDFNLAGPEVELAPDTRNGQIATELRIAAHPDGGAVSAWELCDVEPCVLRTARIRSDGFLSDHAGGQSRGTTGRNSLDFWWSGSAFELLSETGVTTIGAEGRSVIRRLALQSDERVVALTRSGDRRLLLTSRPDPLSGRDLLHAAFVDASSWQLPPAERRRSAGH